MLTLDRITMEDAGIYQCTAENGVGKPVSLDMKLDVLCELGFLAKNAWQLLLLLLLVLWHFAINIISLDHSAYFNHLSSPVAHRIPHPSVRLFCSSSECDY